MITFSAVLVPAQEAGAWWSDDDYWDDPWYHGGYPEPGTPDQDNQDYAVQ